MRRRFIIYGPTSNYCYCYYFFLHSSSYTHRRTRVVRCRSCYYITTDEYDLCACRGRRRNKHLRTIRVQTVVLHGTLQVLFVHTHAQIVMNGRPRRSISRRILCDSRRLIPGAEKSRSTLSSVTSGYSRA